MRLLTWSPVSTDNGLLRPSRAEWIFVANPAREAVESTVSSPHRLRHHPRLGPLQRTSVVREATARPGRGRAVAEGVSPRSG